MGCATCSNGNGLPAGCKNNGNCGVSGCNKLEVFDWLSDIALPSGFSAFAFAEVRFKNGRKGFYKVPQSMKVFQGDTVTVEGAPGYDIGVISLSGELVRIQMQRKNRFKGRSEEKRILHKSTEVEIEKWVEARNLENETMIRSRQIALALGLDMKISDVEYQADKTKATFFYISDQRVDFRQLIRKLAEAFKLRVEMRQIGARQEAGRVGGIGSCGRELCCSSWLTDFRTVSTSAARYQQLAINPQKLAGQCGKLKCCLNYELDSYLDALKEFPKANIPLFTKKGKAVHFKTDIFKKKMWYIYQEEGHNDPIELSVKRVKEIMNLNKRKKNPDDLIDLQREFQKDSTVTDLVGQESLTRFDRGSKRKKKRQRTSGNRKSKR